MDNQLTYGIIKYCAEYVDIKKKKKKSDQDNIPTRNFPDYRIQVGSGLRRALPCMHRKRSLHRTERWDRPKGVRVADLEVPPVASPRGTLVSVGMYI